jgi:hypothetical protein
MCVFYYNYKIHGESEKKVVVTVPDGKGQGQPACPKEWKRCVKKRMNSNIHVM